MFDPFLCLLFVFGRDAVFGCWKLLSRYYTSGLRGSGGGVDRLTKAMCSSNLSTGVQDNRNQGGSHEHHIGTQEVLRQDDSYHKSGTYRTSWEWQLHYLRSNDTSPGARDVLC